MLTILYQMVEIRNFLLSKFLEINGRYRYYFVTGILKRYVTVTVNEG